MLDAENISSPSKELSQEEPQDYPEPTAFLLSYGDARKLPESTGPYGWPDYVKEFGFCLDDLPHLIRMLRDPTIASADSDDPRVWADIHAWRTIGQLRAVSAVEDLLHLLKDEDDEEENWDDWIPTEIPKVLGLIGVEAVGPLARYLDNRIGLWGLVGAARALENISNKNPEVREECISILSRSLSNYRDNDDVLNAFLIDILVELKATESLDLIRCAFQEEKVDIFLRGDLEDVEIDLGVRELRSTARPRYFWTEDERPLSQKRTMKIGRNDPCPCDSGKKYKKCCLNKSD